MKKIRYSFFTSLLYFAFALSVPVNAESDFFDFEIYDTCCCCEPTYSFADARLELGYSTGDYIYLREGYAELGFFAPLTIWNNWVPFADVRGYRFENGKLGSSLGLGCRTRTPNNTIIGLNSYWDFKQGQHFGNFDRFGVGLEVLTPCWDFRLNGYFPVGNHAHHGNTVIFDDFIGDYFATCEPVEFLIGGFDAELGTTLFCGCQFKIYGALGPYFYSNSRIHEVWGCFGRIDIFWSRYISIQVRSTYDHVNRIQTQGRLMLTIPFELFSRCKSCRDCCRERITQPIRRNGIIFTDIRCKYNWNW